MTHRGWFSKPHEDAGIALDAHGIGSVQLRGPRYPHVAPLEDAVVKANRAMAHDPGCVHIRQVELAAVLHDERA